jgi:hypothetical protein
VRRFNENGPDGLIHFSRPGGLPAHREAAICARARHLVRFHRRPSLRLAETGESPFSRSRNASERERSQFSAFHAHSGQSRPPRPGQKGLVSKHFPMVNATNNGLTIRP